MRLNRTLLIAFIGKYISDDIVPKDMVNYLINELQKKNIEVSNSLNVRAILNLENCYIIAMPQLFDHIYDDIARTYSSDFLFLLEDIMRERL